MTPAPPPDEAGGATDASQEASAETSTSAVFDGFIAGMGSTSGIRLVVGIWPRSPLGSFLDVMVETPDGHRTLIAPSTAVADYVAGTYQFDEVRREDLDLQRDGPKIHVSSESLQLRFRVGSRPVLGAALSVVPARLATARWWTSALDPIARTLLPGVRTTGSAGNGRREFYSALDLHRLTHLSGSFEGRDLGGLAPVRPAVQFGFGSVPEQPSIVRVVTTVAEQQ